MTLNKMMIIGNLGADPELRYTPAGKAVTNLRVAVNRNFKGPDGEWQEETMWFRIDVWDQRGERAAEQLRKGNKVYVEGRLRAREWEGNDGQKRTSLEITADNVISLERRDRDATFSEGGGEEPVGAGARQTPPRREPRPAAAGNGDAIDVDDIPF